MSRKFLALLFPVICACGSNGTSTNSAWPLACGADRDCPSEAGLPRCVAGKCEPAGASGSLAGTWEVIGSRLGSTQRSAVVTLSPTTLTVAAWSGNLSAVLHGTTFDVSYEITGHSGGFSAVRTAAPSDTGVIPLPLFGDWDAHAVNTPGCTVHAGPDSASATCSHSSLLPVWIQGAGAATLTATRTEVLQSAFGDFGGTWSLTTGVGASCTVRFEGTTLSANCANAKNATGNASFTLDGDTGHGSTSQGIEFSAQRM